MNIKNWISDWNYRRNHDKNAKRLNKSIESRYYKSNTTDIIKILSEINTKAGLNSYNIVPYLIKIKLMSEKGSMTEKGNDKIVTDRERNTELFSELERLEFIRIIDDSLYSFKEGIRYPTPITECVLRVKLLPKGIDYLAEYKHKRFGRIISFITIIFSAFALGISIFSLNNPTSEKYNKLDKSVDSIKNILNNSINYVKKK